ncbi:MAG: isoleucine--tRNA ligase [bacterium]
MSASASRDTHAPPAAGARFETLAQGEAAPAREQRILAFWEKHDVFRRSMEPKNAAAENFVFFEGPPTANAHPGVHHAAARIVKDLFCRYQTMLGKRVLRKGGWDCHGLPVELEVEKALKLSTKGDVEKYGIAAFNAKCRERVMTFAEEWTRLSARIGFWSDTENAYMTLTNSYVESVWWILSELHRKGLVFEGRKVVPYCPRCETSLSSHEVSQGYKDVQDPSVFVRFRVAGASNRSFLVWTTTPWTLISNVALAVNPDIDYVLAAAGGEEMWIAQARAAAVLDGDWTVVEKKTGAELAALGLRYEPLFPFADAGDAGYRLVTAGFVSTEDGTGIVHMAPAFGEDDANVGRQHGLPTLQPVDLSGKFTDAVTPWAGRFVKDADADILRDLKTRGLLFKRDTLVHSYPHCWRCESPLLYFAKTSWFVKTTAYQDALIRENNSINWVPDEIGSGRFGQWLEGNIDWNLSRDRYWGTPLPVWRCAACGPSADICIGSVEELARRSGRDLASLDLHRPYVDEIEFACGACGGSMRRVSPVIDAWFDSGSMPFAQWHYPFENKHLVDEAAAPDAWAKRRQFPADFISEGLDQTRGWFYSLLAVSTLLDRGTSYKNCVVIGLIQDEHGKKMSKSKGNVVDPWKVIDGEGADALRWYLLWSSPPSISKRFNITDLAETGRRYIGTLENLYNFFALYAAIDGYDPGAHTVSAADLKPMDQWIRWRLEDLVVGMRKALGAYDTAQAARALQAFVIDDLSNWYVRRSRSRFWAGGVEADKIAAFDTLYTCLVESTKLAAPFTPFIAEDLYQKLVARTATSADSEGARAQSVHLAEFPTARIAGAGDTARSRALAQMELVRSAVALGRAARNAAAIKTRQPLARASLVLPENARALLDTSLSENARLREIILDELNLKQIVILTENDVASRLRLSVKLRFDKFGARLGKKAKAFAAAMQGLPEDSLRDYARRNLTSIAVDGDEIALEGDEAEVKREALAASEVFAEESGIGVLLDTALNADLVSEGFAREVVNKIQFMRKEADFQVADRIHVTIETASEALSAAVEQHRDYIAEETLAIEIAMAPAAGEATKSWDINGEAAQIGLSRAAAPTPSRRDTGT